MPAVYEDAVLDGGESGREASEESEDVDELSEGGGIGCIEGRDGWLFTGHT